MFVTFIQAQLTGQVFGRADLPGFTHRRTRQQRLGFDLQQPGGDHQKGREVICCHPFQSLDVGQVLIGHLRQGDCLNIQFSTLDQIKQYIEREPNMPLDYNGTISDMTNLTHLDPQGKAHMVDVGHKPVTERIAVARGEVHMTRATFDLIGAGAMKKGSQIANFLPMETQAQSRVTLIRCWLMNWHVDVWAFYEPILKQVLQGWSAAQAYIILDGVMIFGDCWQIFRVSLQHGCRAIPLAWVVVAGKGLTTVQCLRTRLERVQRLLDGRVKSMVFLADCGFCACDWAQLCLDLGWNYVIRVACNTCITLEEGRTARLDAWVSPYRNRYFQNIWLTQEQKLRTNLSVTWTTDKNGQPEMIAVISHRIACRTRLREHSYHMSIEQSFCDDKSGGFNMAHIQLQHADRIERLLLAMAIATLWCHELGEHVLQQGEAARPPN